MPGTLFLAFAILLFLLKMTTLLELKTQRNLISCLARSATKYPIAALFAMCACALQANAAETTVKVLSINVGSADNSATRRAKLTEIIQTSGADVVGVQQLDSGQLEDLRSRLQTATGVKWYAFQQSTNGANTFDNAVTSADEQILSRYPVLQGMAALAPPSPSRHVLPQYWGAQVEITPGHNAWIVNSRLESFPYQPDELDLGTLAMNEAAIVADATNTRGAQLTDVFNSMNAVNAVSGPVFWTGDFNEPSHLDWTAAATNASSRTFDLQVAWPTSTRIAQEGFTDSYRAINSNPSSKPGFTWTTGTPGASNNVNVPAYPDGSDAYNNERIDYVYHFGNNISVLNSQTIGHPGTATNPRLIDNDIYVNGYNTDHAAVLGTYKVGNLAGSKLTFSKLGTNQDSIPQTYGDRLVTTPNITASYSAFAAGNGVWKFYELGNWNLGGAAFLDSGGSEQVTGTNTIYELTLTPDTNFGVILSAFELLDFADNDGNGQSVRWELKNALGTVLHTGLANIADGARLQIETLMSAPLYESLTLRLQHLGGSRNDLAVDNIAFSQIPEPSTIALTTTFTLSILGLAILRNTNNEQRRDPC